jgi:spore coat protein U-like protein
VKFAPVMTPKCLPLLLALAAAPAWAQSTSCSSSGMAVDLGTYVSYQSTHLDSAATMTVTCSRTGGPGNVTVTVGLGPSSTSGGIATRRLRGPVDVLAYNLYRDTSRALAWGDTIGGNAVTQTFFVKNNTSQTFTFTVFGRIHALQDIAAGFYQDSLVMTVTF